MSEVSKIDAGVDTWLKYNPNVGVDGLHIIGLPGTGKTNMGTGLVYECLLRGEILIMPGDRFCEWRHFLVRKQFQFEPGYKLKVLVPDGIDIHYHKFEKNGWFQDTDYRDINVMDHFQEDEWLKVLVVYDQHLKLSDRCWLWVGILQQLLSRTYRVDKPVILFFNEAGILFPEMVKGKDHWEAIHRFSELFVECRKGLVRVIFVSQLKTEVEHTLRKKCMHKIFRKCWPGKDEPVPVQKRAPRQDLNEYISMRGGLYVRYNRVDLFKENKESFKMIPPYSMYEDTRPSSASAKFPHKCRFCEYEWEGMKEKPRFCPNCNKRNWREVDSNA